MLCFAGHRLAGFNNRALPTRAAGIENEGFAAASEWTSLDEAKQAELPPKSVILLEYVTLEELANRNLYREHSTDNDLIGVIHSSETSSPATVQGLRCYLGSLQAEGERATLNGQFAANIGIDEMKQIYGEPFSETAEQSGRSHLVYYFADPANAGLAYKLTTSHDYTGKIFSMALEQTLAPQ